MQPYCFRVREPDAHLGLAPDEILLVSGDAPSGLFVAWPRPRRLVPNYGYLVGLFAADRIVCFRPANLRIYLDAVASLTAQPGRRPRTLDRTTKESARGP